MSLIILDESVSNYIRYVQYQCTICGYVGKMKKSHFNAGTGCRVCNGKEVLKGYNDVATTNPDLVNYFKDKSEAQRITAHSGKKIETKCPVCGLVEQHRMCDITRRGYKCSVCYGGFSIPNRFMSALLNHLEVEFVTEKTFDWSGKARYDFYIPSTRTIIEMHGMQHYSNRVGWGNFQEIQLRDKQKKELALSNGVLNYVEIPSIRSEVDFLKDAVVSSNVLSLLNVSQTDIDWATVYNFVKSGIPVSCLNLWISGVHNTSIIANTLGVGKDSVAKYLKEYASSGLCDYSVQSQKQIGLKAAHTSRKRSVMCQNTGETFDSIRAAAQHFGIAERALQNHLSGRCMSSGKDANGNKLIWKYL